MEPAPTWLAGSDRVDADVAANKFMTLDSTTQRMIGLSLVNTG